MPLNMKANSRRHRRSHGSRLPDKQPISKLYVHAYKMILESRMLIMLEIRRHQVKIFQNMTPDEN